MMEVPRLTIIELCRRKKSFKVSSKENHVLIINIHMLPRRSTKDGTPELILVILFSFWTFLKIHTRYYDRKSHYELARIKEKNSILKTKREVVSVRSVFLGRKHEKKM